MGIVVVSTGVGFRRRWGATAPSLAGWRRRRSIVYGRHGLAASFDDGFGHVVFLFGSISLLKAASLDAAALSAISSCFVVACCATVCDTQSTTVSHDQVLVVTDDQQRLGKRSSFEQSASAG
jgi:hypothetical protein